MIALYHQIKTPINFWYRRGLNPISLIQPSETLPVELTETHLLHRYLSLHKSKFTNDIINIKIR